MGCFSGTNIVDDGLILALDASAIKKERGHLRYRYWTNWYSSATGHVNSQTDFDGDFVGNGVASGIHSNHISWATSGSYGTKPSYLPAENFAWEVSGYLWAPTAGTYNFGTGSDDGNQLTIAGTIVTAFYAGRGISGSASSPADTGSITLSRGYHTFRYRMREGAGGDGAYVSWRPPGSASYSLIPASSFAVDPDYNAFNDISGNGNYIKWGNTAPSFTTYNGIPVLRTSGADTTLRAMLSENYNNMTEGAEPYSVFAIFRPISTSSAKILYSFGEASSNCSAKNTHPIAIGNQGKFAGGTCGGLGTWSTTSGATPSTTRFWCICTTYDGTTERVYEDAVQQKTATFTNAVPASSSSNKICLGWIRDDGASYSMNADIGVIYHYNRVLSQDEINQNFNILRGRYGI